ncbi:MAG: flagellar motor switch protein FliG [Deltaproteobacteria bacterium]|nr:flagellar motor switch protein FliG [Deltaproteobacteria bacterium]
MSKNLKGIEKAAIFMASIGEELAAEVTKHLTHQEIQKVGAHLTNMEHIPEDVFIQVASEFESAAMPMTARLNVDGHDYVKNILVKALGHEKGDDILDKIIKRKEEGGLDSLRWMDAKIVAEMIKNEHPQTIAVILSYLEPEHAAKVISYFAARLRNEVVMRVASTETVAPGAIEDLEEAIRHHLSGNIGVHASKVGGIKMAAEILNNLDTAAEKEIVQSIEAVNVHLANSIQEQMFVFADLARIDDRAIQTLMKEITNDQLVLALKAADKGMKDKFLSNMSERAREMVTDEMETKGPVRLTDVTQAQQDIVRIARRLAQEGQIMLGGGAGEVFV